MPDLADSSLRPRPGRMLGDQDAIGLKTFAERKKASVSVCTRLSGVKLKLVSTRPLELFAYH